MRRRSTGVIGAACAVAVALSGIAPAAATDARDEAAGGQGATSPGIERLGQAPIPEALDGWATDVAFADGHAFVGNLAGVAVHDLTDPADPRVRTVIHCPGSQGDVSVHGDLLFVSVEDRGERDCTTPTRGGDFRGVRVFDVSDLDAPRQVATVATCRGSHTHTLVPDGDRVVILSSAVRPPRGDAATDAAGRGCRTDGPADRADARWAIDVLEVPLARPERARLVARPRVVAEDGRIDGLQQQPPSAAHPSGEPWRPRPVSTGCHDLTAYPGIGLAAGACQGNGILLDITDPHHPVRVAEVADPEFSYWHSATFNDDGSTVVFTDEWGGGALPRCRPQDGDTWGGNGIYTVAPSGGQDRFGPAGSGRFTLELAGRFKIPPVEHDGNCVAHNGSLVPVPGRDVMVQGWYQGGVSVWEFTDPTAPVELARVPRDHTPDLGISGVWSAYWHDGHLVSSDMHRGLETYALVPSEALGAAELAAAAAAGHDHDNAQTQTRYGPGPAAVAAVGVPCGAVTSTSSSGGGAGAGFADVGPPHDDGVRCAAAFGVARGVGPDTYAPGAPVRRDQAASFLVRVLDAAGVDLPAGGGTGAGGFTDLRGNVHAAAIGRLAAAGVLEGRTSTRFDPAGTVTRGQLASLLVGVLTVAAGDELGLADPADLPFTDVPGTTHADGIGVAAMRRLVVGTSTSTYAPGAPVTRGQLGSTLAALLRAVASEGHDLTPPPP